ncbi:putative Notch [Daphnia magna]|uniref:Putative Notch n=1 Tax=Daphnia magna TaxID=35525 RepID=A0A164SUK9_9CRUS|nr:putative Notch [Daphnia magna]
MGGGGQNYFVYISRLDSNWVQLSIVSATVIPTRQVYKTGNVLPFFAAAITIYLSHRLIQNETLKHSCIFNHPYFIYVAKQPVRCSRNATGSRF